MSHWDKLSQENKIKSILASIKTWESKLKIKNLSDKKRIIAEKNLQGLRKQLNNLGYSAELDQ
jgi:hypothetical protein